MAAEHMRDLTVAVDGRILFAGKVAEYGLQENGETVTITARFAPAPSIMEALTKIANAAAAKTPETVETPEPNGSPDVPSLTAVPDATE